MDPYPPDASTVRQSSRTSHFNQADQASQARRSSGPVSAGGPPPPSSPTGAPTTRPFTTRAPKAPPIPGMRRRLALLAAALYMPLILLGYALYLHGPTDCVVGAVCSLDTWPAFAQGLLLA
ncbi:MAG TPA: hypothetical protein VFU60_10900, partial [Ktedonobacterales bacterium]|nr:hypothetical protein [Ktedonobacterales bacterium]